MNNNRVLESKDVDSMYISKSEDYMGKAAFKFVSFNYSTSEESDTYFYTDNVRLYTNMNSIMPGEGSGFIIPIGGNNGWIKVADNSASSWIIFDTTFSGIDMPIEGVGTGKLSGQFKIEGEKGTTKNFTIQGSTIQAQEFKIKYSFTGTLTIFGIPVQIPFTLTMHQWYANNIGLVQSIMDSQNLTFATFSQDIPGFESMLVKYNVQK